MDVMRALMDGLALTGAHIGRPGAALVGALAVSGAALLSLALVGLGGAAEPPPEVAALAREWLDHPKTKAPGISVAAFNRSGIVWSGGYGLADLEKRTPATAKTRYHFASITKVHTTLILAQMAVEGKVNVDDPVTKYLPRFAPRYPEPGARPITLRDLATHSAGLTNYWGRGTNSPTEEDLVEWLRESALAVQPGCQKKYSNYGASLLGLALARAAGKPYETLLRERVLEPLRMTSSGLEELYDAPDLARGYAERGGKLVAVPRSGPFYAQAPASAVVSNVEDIARFGIAHLSRDPESAVPPRIQGLLFTLHASGTGLGWHYSRGGVPRWWHLGAWNMNYTRLVVRPDVGVGLVLATNGPWGYDPVVSFVKLLAPYADTSDLDALCGRYADAEGEVLVHRPPGPEMTLEIKGTGRLLPISRHTFRVSGGGKLDSTWVRFIREDGGEVMLWERRRLVKGKP